MAVIDYSKVRLMGGREIGDRLGVSRQRAYVIAARRDFPAPRWHLAMGDVWLADDVEAWIRKRRPELAGPEQP